VLRAPEPHHLEGERFLAEVGRRAEPDRQVDLPEGLDALARRDAMERRRAGSQLVQPDPQQAQGVRVEDVEAATSVHQNHATRFSFQLLNVNAHKITRSKFRSLKKHMG
jgi:hypothetical protein